MKRIIPIIIAFIVAALTTYWVLNHTSKKINDCQQVEAEYMGYLKEYSTLSSTKENNQENYLEQSCIIYCNLCAILIKINPNDKFGDLGVSIVHSLNEIFNDQAAVIKSLNNSSLQYYYIKNILSQEDAILHQINNQYEETMINELRQILELPTKKLKCY